jgi:V/A-type H+-transporting ATPase subunit I
MITLWGTLTGTWFGSRLVNFLPPLKEIALPIFSDANPSSQEFIIFLVLSLGFTQIMIAHIWNFFNELRTGKGIRSFAQIGWILIVTAVGWLILNLVVSSEKYPLNSLVPLLVLKGFLIVLIFGSQEKGTPFLKGALAGLAGIMQTALGCLSSFSDILSYIRLFAVGLSGVAIADSFNALGLGLFGSGIMGILGGIVIILFGHLMCLALGMLSMIVHGVRLNLLEFSSHLGQEWNGQVYKPFEKKN